MYSAHLRDMYNFDPLAVEQFLKEMRLLSAQGQTAAQAMKSKLISLPGIVATSASANAYVKGGNDDGGSDEAKGEHTGLPNQGGAAAKGDKDGEAVGRKDQGGACGPAGIDHPRASQRCFIRSRYLVCCSKPALRERTLAYL